MVKWLTPISPAIIRFGFRGFSAITAAARCPAGMTGALQLLDLTIARNAVSDPRSSASWSRSG